MDSPAPAENKLAHGHKYVLEKFIQRLLGAISQSPLLKVRFSKSGRLIDCHRLEQVTPGLSNELLQGILDGGKPTAVQLDLRALKQRGGKQEGDPHFAQPESGDAAVADPVAQEHLRLHRTLEKTSRDAELVKRETGRHALWLGYPLLHASSANGDILAPVFLWPITIRFDFRRQGRVLIGRAGEQKPPIPPQFNRVMAAWLRRQIEVQLANVTTDAELLELDREAVARELLEIGAQFHPALAGIDCQSPLEPAPVLKALESQNAPRFYHSAVLGYFRWQNEAILADLESLRQQDHCAGVASAFAAGAELPAADPVPPPPEADRFLVCDSDFSQERVVWQARARPGLVVHGPPGTGKSQTIVNVIADALAHQRTVLMVCQKQAATRVVLERLRAAGLADLCMEVHDAAADRHEVFKTIREQVDDLKPSSTSKADTRQELSARIGEVEKLLDDHARALHEQHPRIGLSYRQLRAREGRLQAELSSLRELASLRNSLEKLSAQQIRELLPRIQRAGQLFRSADPLNNPWCDRQPTVTAAPAMRADITTALGQLQAVEEEHMQHVGKHGAPLVLPPSISDFVATAADLAKRLRRLQESSSLCQFIQSWAKQIRESKDTDVARRIRDCQAALRLANDVETTSHNPAWSSVLGGKPLHELKTLRAHAENICHGPGSWWAVLSRYKYWRAKRAIESLQSPTSGHDLQTTAESLVAHLRADVARKELRDVTSGLLPGLQPGGDEKQQIEFAKLAHDGLQSAKSLVQLQKSQEWSRAVIDQVLRDSANLTPMLEALEREALRAAIVDRLLKALSALERFLNPSALEPRRADALAGKSLQPWIKSAIDGLGKLQSLIALEAERQQRSGPERDILAALESYQALLAKGEKLPAAPGDLAVEKYGAWWSALVEYAAVMIWQRQICKDHPVLLQVTPDVQEATRDELRTLLEKKRSLEAPTIRERWLELQLQTKDAPWPKLFQQRSSKLNKAPRLREAVAASLPYGLLKLRPCWLVNPEAAAQIFPLEQELFDLVIFDEASQCPIEQAVPAIYRGKGLVVSGDAKQLPPTDFFAARSGDSDADEGEDTEATEERVEAPEQVLQKFGAQFLLQEDDLLEVAIGSLRPPQWLKVHYRSEHPDLIGFSNRAFYNGRLEAPPAQLGADGDHRPILYHEVAGLYSNRTNYKEAAKVIELLREIWARDGPAPTIGVVTFNQPQRELIQDLIDEACQQDDAFELRYEQEKARREERQDVGFFVKNLENVQGDERDLMIFSTTFGRDAAGRFYRRFGPVGAKGGERRLNVAVTRAKKQVIVVCSMPITEISDALRPGSSESRSFTPAGFLQLYLAYAKAVSAGNRQARNQILDLVRSQSAPVKSEGEPESPLEEEVRSALEKLGYAVDSQVGESGFRIDMAVRHPDPAHGYLLGIECDGATYHSDRSARSRDVWREKILRQRKWRLHRIWSTAWWYERAKEMQKLEAALSDAIKASEKNNTTAENAEERGKN